MHHPRCLVTSLLTGLILFTGACAPASQNASYPNQTYPDTVGSLKTEAPQATAIQDTPTNLPEVTKTPHKYLPTPTHGPVEWGYTPTPDPNFYTSVVKIVGDYSQEEIAGILYAKWLDHFLGENISAAYRLDSYVIDKIDVPVDQHCAKVSGALFFVLTSLTMKTILPINSNTSYEHTGWTAGGGSSVDDYRMRKLFPGVVYKEGDTYTLQIIINVPYC